MSFSASAIKNLNRSMRANQDIQAGTFLSHVDDVISASQSMYLQSASQISVSGGSLSNVIITSASITNSKFSGSIVTPYPPVVGQILSFGSQGNEWINNMVPNGLVLQGDWNALTNTPDLVTGSSLIPTGHMWRVSVAGSTVLGPETTWEVNDLAVKTEDSWVEIEAATTMSTWGNITGSLVDQTDLWADLNSRVSASTLALHTNASGSSVHGLGTISTQNASLVSISGSFTGTVISASAKFGTGNDYTYFEADGTMGMSGSATVWEDLRFPATAINPAGAPGPMGFDTSRIGFTAAAGQTQTIAVVAQLPHSYKLGSTIYPHVHWMPTTTNSGSCLWRIEYKWVDVGSVEPAGFTALDVGQNASGSAYTHQLVGWTVSGSSISNISSLLTILISRIGGSDSYTGTALLKEFDIHYQIDSLGSREALSK